jgi:hypothetical protein
LIALALLEQELQLVPIGEGDGWETISGVHVHVDADGNIDKGPTHMVGRKPHEVASRLPRDKKDWSDKLKSSVAGAAQDVGKKLKDQWKKVATPEGRAGLKKSIKHALSKEGIKEYAAKIKGDVKREIKETGTMLKVFGKIVRGKGGEVSKDEKKEALKQFVHIAAIAVATAISGPATKGVLKLVSHHSVLHSFVGHHALHHGIKDVVKHQRHGIESRALKAAGFAAAHESLQEAGEEDADVEKYVDALVDTILDDLDPDKLFSDEAMEDAIAAASRGPLKGDEEDLDEGRKRYRDDDDDDDDEDDDDKDLDEARHSIRHSDGKYMHRHLDPELGVDDVIRLDSKKFNERSRYLVYGEVPSATDGSIETSTAIA